MLYIWIGLGVVTAGVVVFVYFRLKRNRRGEQAGEIYPFW